MQLDAVVHPEVVNWLLEPENPSVRFWTLQQLQIKPQTDPKVQETQKAIMNSPVVNAILAAQAPEGHWGNPTNMYLKKYTATTHSLLVLAELGVKRTPAIERAIEHLFHFQLDSGHFVSQAPKTARGRASPIRDSCCMDANILYYLTHFEYLDHPRVRQLIHFITSNHDSQHGGWPCRAYPITPSTVFPTNCYMGLCKVLRSLSVLPPNHITPMISSIIQKTTEVILENSVYKYLRNPDGSRKEKFGWKRFGFPLFYNSDVLEVLDTLTQLEVHDPRMQDAIDLVLAQQTKDGKWILKNSFNGKMWHDIEEKGRPSKWITLRALRVLRRFFS